jgi:cytochrome oxidase assembly protein ShyY1
MFSPSNQPEKQQWFMLDVEDMSRHTGADPILLEEISGK